MASNFLERFKHKSSTISKNGDINLGQSSAVNKSPTHKKSVMQLSGNYIIGNSPNIQNKQEQFSKPINMTQYSQATQMQYQFNNSFQNTQYEVQSEIGGSPVKNFKYSDLSGNYIEHQKKNVLRSNVPKSAQIIQQNRQKPPVIPTSAQRQTQYSTQSQRTIDFQPYSVQDYRLIKPEKYYELGSLGSGYIGTNDWQQKQTQLKRRQEYANQVNFINKAKPPAPRRQKVENVQQSARQKALEFAKNVPVPTVKRRSTQSTPPQERNVDPLDQLQQEHERYKASIENIKNLWKD